MLQSKQAVLKIAVVEDSFSARDYKGDENIEYNVTPYTTMDELQNALSSVNPDIVILNELSNPYGIAPLLKDQYTLLLSAEEPDIHKWRKAISYGIKGIVQKPVTYEKIISALQGSFTKEQQGENNIIYIEEAQNVRLPRTKIRRSVEPKIDLPSVEEIKKEIRPVLLQSNEKGKVITFFNTKGGVGKTLYSINTAIYIAKMYPSKKIALVDFDLDFGDVANFLGLKPRITALSWQYIPEDSLREADVENYLMKHPTGIFVLPAPIPPIDEEIFTYKIAHKILSTLKKRFDLIVVDLGPTLRDVVVITIEHADKVFLVSTTNVSSLRNIYDLIKIFEGLKINPSKIDLILNAVKKNISSQELKKYIPYSIVLKVPYIKQVETMNDNYELALNNKRFRIYLDDLAFKIMNKEPDKKGFFAFLRGGN